MVVGGREGATQTSLRNSQGGRKQDGSNFNVPLGEQYRIEETKKVRMGGVDGAGFKGKVSK